MTVKRDDVLQNRRTGRKRIVIGFTTKPDGIRRARLVDADGNETKARVDQITRNYKYA